MQKDELPYVVLQLQTSSVNEAALESLAKHGFDTALMSVSSGSDLRRLKRSQSWAGEFGLSLIPMIVASDDLLASEEAIGQLCESVLGMAKRVSMMLRGAQCGDFKVTLRRVTQLVNRLRGHVLLLWLDLHEGVFSDDDLMNGIRKLSMQIEPRHICVNTSVPFGDPEAALKLAQRHFGNVSLWVALTVEGAQFASGAEPLSACIPCGDHLRIFTYAAVLGSACGVILPNADELMEHRQDLFKAASVASAEAKIMLPFWRGACEVSDILDFAIERNGKPADEHLRMRARCFITKGSGDVEAVLSAVLWLPCSELRLPVGSYGLTLRYPISGWALGRTPRAYLLRFPSPKRLQVRFKSGLITLSIPDFDVAESVFISPNMPSVEELHWQMNAVGASVMQFEVQQALREFELAKAILNSLRGKVKQLSSGRLRVMGRLISSMLSAARKRHAANAIEMAKEFRRQYRSLLCDLAFGLKQSYAVRDGGHDDEGEACRNT